MRCWPSVDFPVVAKYGLAALLSLFLLTAAAQEDRGALVTALEGKAALVKGNEKRPLEAFERLEAGDAIVLDQARLTIVFFLTGRQEAWQGSGRLEIGPGEGKSAALSAPQVKTLAPYLVKQIAKTPILLAQGRAGATRLRALATPEAIAKVDEAYRRLQMESAAGDLSPEMYRLSALFEMKAFDAVEAALGDLELSYPRYNEAKLLVALYRKALKNAREAR
ncbi:hypothetical protein [Sulfuricystis multivorans]|uniref:hypothetical protein n=1 Tax=Sulfuricystis multivorans TaxID=2211108 RepID=UPI000F834765|nr:hypothetical protein [Sulfuricystis multivorans]